MPTGTVTQNERGRFDFVAKPVGPDRRPKYIATCGKCGSNGTVNVGGGHKHLSEDRVRNALINAGWYLGTKRGRDVCPTCVAREKEKKAMASQELKIVQGKASPEAMEMRRKVRAGLEAYFDENKGVYTGGYSDEKIARESGASADFVASVRETFYGPLKKSASVEDVQRDASEARDALSKAQKTYDEWGHELRRIEGALGRLSASLKRLSEIA